MWRQQRWAYYQKGARSSEKPVSAFFLPCFLSSLHSSFLLSFFFPVRFTRPPYTNSKGLPDTPLSEALSPMCVWKRAFEHLISHTFYPLCLLWEKNVEEEKQKERWKEESWGGRGAWEAEWVIAAHQHREQSVGLQPASATIQLLLKRVDLEKTFQRGREKSGRWQKYRNGWWKNIRVKEKEK